MSSPVGYLLDTNALLELLRGNDLGEALDARFGLRSSLGSSMICVVTVGEILALARKFGWGTTKLDKLRRMLDQLVWIDISDPQLLDAYAEIDHFSETKGRKMGKNDIWIAATAKVTGITLLTTDPDFDHLEGTHLARIWIDPACRKQP